jgi:Ca2+/Na+ antiporter
MSGWLIFFWSGVLALAIAYTYIYATTKIPDEEGKEKEDAKTDKKNYMIAMIVCWIGVIVVPIAMLFISSSQY